MPVKVWILPARAVFLFSCWVMVTPWVEGDKLGLMRCEPLSPIAGFMPPPGPIPCPCWANTGIPHNITANARTVICKCFIGLLSSLRTQLLLFARASVIQASNVDAYAE